MPRALSPPPFLKKKKKKKRKAIKENRKIDNEIGSMENNSNSE